MNIGKAVKKTRERVGITQEELSKISMVERTHISDIERGASDCTTAVFIKLANGMHVPPSVLMLLAELLI